MTEFETVYRCECVLDPCEVGHAPSTCQNASSATFWREEDTDLVCEPCLQASQAVVAGGWPRDTVISDDGFSDPTLACDIEGCSEVGAWSATRADQRVVLCRGHFANVGAAMAVQRASREVVLAMAQLPLAAVEDSEPWVWDVNFAAFPAEEETNAH